MKPNDLKHIDVDSIEGFFTNIDQADLSKNYAWRTRGFRFATLGLLQRDFGTIHRYSSYPIPIQTEILNGFTLFIQEENKEYDIIVGLDSSDNTRIFVNDGTWIELTQKLTATVDSVSGQVATISAIKDILGAVYTPTANELIGWIVVNDVRGHRGLTILNTATTLTLMNQPGGALQWVAGDKISLYRSLGVADGYVYQNGTTPHIRWLDVQAQNKVNFYYGSSESPPSMRVPIQIRKSRTILPGAWKRSFRDEAISNIFFTDVQPFDILTSNTLYISGQAGVVLKSTDRGTTWDLTHNHVSDPRHVSSVAVAPNPPPGEEHVFICGRGGTIRKSIDGGSTWVTQTTGVNVSLNKIRFASNLIGWAVGDAAGGFGTILFTSNGGTTWTPQTSGVPNQNLNSIATRGTDSALVVGNGGTILKTINSGTTWTALTSGVTQNLHSVSNNFSDVNTWWAVGDGEFVVGPVVLKSVNFGTSWTNQRANFPSPYNTSGFNLLGVSAAGPGTTNTDIVYVAGQNGMIWKTANAGTTWNLEQQAEQVDFRAIYFDYDERVWAVGDNNTLLQRSMFSHFGWHVDKTQTLPTYKELGSVTSPKVVPTTYEHSFGVPLEDTSMAETVDIGEGISVRLEGMMNERDDSTATTRPEGSNKTSNVRMYMTVLYGGYQESDPIFKLYLGPGKDINSAYRERRYPKPRLTLSLDHGRFNKNITGFRFYLARTYEELVKSVEWVDTPAEYILIYEATMSDQGWLETATNIWSLSIPLNKFSLTLLRTKLTSGPSNLADNLGHPVDITRSYLTPRYAVKAARPQGAQIVADQNDQVLRLSAYGGDGTHMDDVFPDVTTDNNGGKQKIFLSGKGEMLGLAFHLDDLVVLRGAEMERLDITSGVSRITPIDCVAKRSILETPYGLVWAGRSGIYLLPSSGSEIQTLNLPWLNYYDGTLVDTEATPVPYVTDTDRENIITGYDETFRELWVQMTSKELDPGDTGVTALSVSATFAFERAAGSFVTDGFVVGERIRSSGFTNVGNNVDKVISTVAALSITVTDTTGMVAEAAGADERIRGLGEHLCFRYNFDTGKWFVRKLNITGNDVKFFSRRKDGTFTIGFGSGLLKYPVRQTLGGWTAHIHEDQISSAGLTASRGIETSIRLNYGELYGLREQAVLRDLVIDHLTEFTGTEPSFDIKLYANGSSTAFDTKTAKATSNGVPRMIRPIGPVERLELELAIPSGSLTAFKKMDVRKISISHTVRERTGNR